MERNISVSTKLCARRKKQPRSERDLETKRKKLLLWTLSKWTWLILGLRHSMSHMSLLQTRQLHNTGGCGSVGVVRLIGVSCRATKGMTEIMEEKQRRGKKRGVVGTSQAGKKAWKQDPATGQPLSQSR